MHFVAFFFFLNWDKDLGASLLTHFLMFSISVLGSTFHWGIGNLSSFLHVCLFPIVGVEVGLVILIVTSSGTVQQTRNATWNLRILAFVIRLVRALRMRTGKGGEVAKANATFFLPFPKDLFFYFTPLLTTSTFVCVWKIFLYVTQCLAYGWQMAKIQNIWWMNGWIIELLPTILI